MNPQRDYEQGDVETTRAFFTLFRKCGDLFKFPIDGGVDDGEEVTAKMLFDPRDYDQDMICVVAIDDAESRDEIASVAKEMGLVIETESEDHEFEGREYTSYLLYAYAPTGISAEWNVPHLLVYGSLDGEVEDCAYAAFGTGVETANIRNHFLVYGEVLEGEDRVKTNFSSAIQRSNSFFNDDQRFYASNISTGDLV